MLVLFYGFIVFILLLLVMVFFSMGMFKKCDILSVSWASPYECGFSSKSMSLDCFSFTYFSLLVFFVIFDLEMSLLLNMPEQGLLYFNFCYYYSFLFILIVGFMLEMIFGYVRWGY